MKKFVCAVIVTGLLSPSLVAQQPSAPSGKEADPVIMTFGSIQVRQSELEAALKTVPAEYQTYALGAGKKAFAEEYARMKILAAEGSKANLDKDPAVAMQIMLLRENALANAQLNKIEAGIQISDADVQKAYDESKSTFEQAKARHILIAFKGSPAMPAGKKELSEEEAKAKAEEIRKKLTGGADFATVAKAESDDTGSGARGGDLGTFSRGQMVAEFEKAVFEGKVGEIGPVVRTQFGYHIIQVQERKTLPLAEVRGQLDKQLRGQRVQQALDSIKDSAKISFNESYFKPAEPPASESPVAPARSAEPKKP